MRLDVHYTLANMAPMHEREPSNHRTIKHPTCWEKQCKTLWCDIALLTIQAYHIPVRPSHNGSRRYKVASTT
jgi:hypothetical protein